MTTQNAKPEVKEAPKQANTAGGDSSNDTLYGILAYIGILVLIPIFLGKDSKFVKFHANQGVLVFIMGLLTPIPLIGWALGIAALVFSVMGIINVVNKQMKPLPLIGNITILK